MYKIENFLLPISEGDNKLFIKDSINILKYSIEVFSIKSSRAINNLIKIITTTRTIHLDFSTTNEAREALEKLQQHIDRLRSNVPIHVERGINNYINSFQFTGGIPYIYSNSLTGGPLNPPQRGIIEFDSASASTTTRMRISFYDADDIQQVLLISSLMSMGGTLLFRYNGGSSVFLVLSSNGGFGSYADASLSYISGRFPDNGVVLSLTVAIGLPHKIYIARINQTSTNPISCSVTYDQTSSPNPTFGYISQGVYSITMTNHFINGTIVSISNSNIENGIISAYIQDTSTIIIKSSNTSFSLTDDLITNELLTISIPQAISSS